MLLLEVLVLGCDLSTALAYLTCEKEKNSGRNILSSRPVLVTTSRKQTLLPAPALLATAAARASPAAAAAGWLTAFACLSLLLL